MPANDGSLDSQTSLSRNIMVWTGLPTKGRFNLIAGVDHLVDPPSRRKHISGNPTFFECPHSAESVVTSLQQFLNAKFIKGPECSEDAPFK